jgi:hypothetical protein
VSQMLPPQDELLGIIKGDQGVMVTNWQELVPVQHPTWKKDGLRVEPGESEQLLYHFVISSDVKTILLYSHFRNRGHKLGHHLLGWHLATISDVQPSEDIPIPWLQKWRLH